VQTFTTKYLPRILWLLLLLALLIEVIRDTQYEGDFIGYVIVGDMVLAGESIYSHYLNTWPPFFSVFCIPISYLHHASPLAANVIWQLGSIAAFFASLTILFRWTFKKGIAWKTTDSRISIFDWKVLVPVLLSFRFVLDNLANIQINMYLLWMSLWVVDLFFRKRHLSASILLAFIISLKVYPIFILLFLIFKREWRIAAFTIVFMLLINALCLPFFGYEGTLANFGAWVQEVMPKSYIANHKNQSLLGLLLRIFTDFEVEFEYKINLLKLSLDQVKLIYYSALIVLALPVMYWFRKPFRIKGNLDPERIQFVLILTAIPLLSPLAWKAYFIFLTPGIVMLHHMIYNKRGLARSFKWSFILALVVIIGSADVFAGPYFSDVLQMYGALVWGTATLLVLLIVLFNQKNEVEMQAKQSRVEGTGSADSN